MKSFLLAAGLVIFVLYRADKFHVNLHGEGKSKGSIHEILREVNNIPAKLNRTYGIAISNTTRERVYSRMNTPINQLVLTGRQSWSIKAR